MPEGWKRKQPRKRKEEREKRKNEAVFSFLLKKRQELRGVGSGMM